MKYKLILVLAITCLFTASFGQKITQTIRGIVTDKDSQAPLIGATIVIVSSDPIIGSTTDLDGNFRLNEVPIGRVTLKISFIGYEDRTVPNLLLNAAKEEILNITLTEAINTLDEVTVTANLPKGEVLNEMALVSARTFSVEETRRFAGSFDDPARLAAGFAGVNGNVAGNNDIVVRGNSPTGILWRLEGITIPNPNHFAGEGSTGGPINALSSRMLGNSDFFTGAFPAEYGGATSGVFDMKLKGGNNERSEYAVGLSTLGLDITAEGPIKAGYRGSYIANYRYSSLDLLDKAGVINFGGVPRYQDMSFKLQLPVNSKHNFSIFGLGGLSKISTEEKDETDDSIVTGKFNGAFKLGVLGASHTFQMNEDMYLKSSLAATGSDNTSSFSIPGKGESFIDVEKATIGRSSFIATSTFNYKVSARHKIETGVILTELNYNMTADERDYEKDQLVNQLSEKGNTATYQAFVNWKYRISDQLTAISGLHYFQLALNNNYSVEPRVAVKYQVSDKQSFNIGAGLHSKMEVLSTYLARQYADDGTFTQRNKNMGLTKAAHFVIGYDNQVGRNSHLKLETYYQYLYDVPVEDSESSSYSLINVSGGYNNRLLINNGTGRNYGVEMTLERYLNRGFYYMSTVSLFRALYTAKDGVERKSAFDNNYVANLIGGKEFKMGRPSKNRVFFVNTKIALIGGKRYSPIDLGASIAAGRETIDERNPFSKKGDDVFRADLSIGVRRNRRHSATELKFDVQNILNNQTVIGESYVQSIQAIYKNRQLGMLPTISYRVSF